MRMEDDLVLSDIHIHTPLERSKQHYITRFFFNLKSDNITADCFQGQENSVDVRKDTESSVVFDEDGDFVVLCRHNRIEIDQAESRASPPSCPNDCNSKLEKSDQKHWKEVITIEHKLQTILKDVGYQVWLGALLMCDYLIHCNDSLKQQIVLDLGAGTGLTSIIAAMFAKFVICTDYSPDIINLAEKNWKRNSDILPSLSDKNNLMVQVLDWTNHRLDSEMSEENAHLYKATLILAAEVVYDEDLTDAFFQTIYFLLREPPCKTVIMAVEKRIVFDMAWRDICSPSYEHFQQNLKDLCSVDEGRVQFTSQQIPSHDIPQYFLYKRTAQLELWKITSQFSNSKLGDK